MRTIDSSLCNKVSGGSGHWGSMPGGSRYPANIMPDGPRLPGESPIGPRVLQDAMDGARAGIGKGLPGIVRGAAKGAMHGTAQGLMEGVSQQN